MNKDQIMPSLKLSEFLKLTSSDRKMVKITGKVDKNSEKTAGRMVLLFSDEAGETRPEVVVDTELLDDFNVADLNPHHDILQFIGYKISSNESRFKAMNFRVISRVTLSSYYLALDVQTSYVEGRKQNISSHQIF